MPTMRPERNVQVTIAASPSAFVGEALVCINPRGTQMVQTAASVHTTFLAHGGKAYALIIRGATRIMPTSAMLARRQVRTIVSRASVVMFLLSVAQCLLAAFA